VEKSPFFVEKLNI
jgi:hypothetical protein